MITGPSIGPAMVLNVLMRWPSLIIVCALGGAGAIVYETGHGDEVIRTAKEYAIAKGLMQAEKVAEAAKNVNVIPTASAETVKEPVGPRRP